MNQEELLKKILHQQKIILVLLFVLVLCFGIILFVFFTKMSEMNSVIKQLQDIDFAQIEDAMKNVNKILHYFN
ncbi:Uncharacterised protein [Chlamydia trachomatis]|nr:Uncharacterised protein [Chlamydia trachomatis]